MIAKKKEPVDAAENGLVKFTLAGSHSETKKRWKKLGRPVEREADLVREMHGVHLGDDVLASHSEWQRSRIFHERCTKWYSRGFHSIELERY